MCEYMFTSLYQYIISCILKYHLQKCLKNADGSLTSISDHYVVVGCSFRQVFSVFLVIFSVSAFPL